MIDPLAPLPPNLAHLQGQTQSFGMTQQLPNAKKGGMFGAKPDWGSAIAAALNGYLAAGGNPAGQMGLQQLHQKKLMEQRQAQEQQQYQMQRQHGLEDYEAKQQIEQRYAAPPKPPGMINEYQVALEKGLIPPTMKYTDYLSTFGRPGMQAPIVLPHDAQQVGGGGMGGGSAPPPEAVQQLQSNPATAAQFDEIFGPGSAARVLGGSGGNAGGNFR